MDKYKNKYRIPSARLQSWDYGWNAAYFVTICTHNRKHFFGEIVETQNFASPSYKMELSQIGVLAEKYWHEIPQHFPFVKLDEFIVMPNHIHGIIIIDKPNDGRDDGNGGNVETPKLGVSTDTTDTDINSKSKTKIGGKNKKWKPNTLGSIINQYKRICTIHARKINPNWQWQSRFYDHIIRNDKSFNRIQNYIINNPINWGDDKFNKEINNG